MTKTSKTAATKSAPKTTAKAVPAPALKAAPAPKAAPTKAPKAAKPKTGQQLAEAREKADAAVVVPAAAPAPTKAQKPAKAAPAAAPAPVETKAPKAPKAPKAKAEKAKRNVDTNSAVHAPETLDACAGKAPKGDSIHARFLQFLAANAQENSESFVNSLRRPLGEFLDWCKSERIVTFAQLDTKALLTYRRTAKRTQDGEERATSTMRMSLARVITFLRAQEEGSINADISLLRVKLTAEERAAEAADAE